MSPRAIYQMPLSGDTFSPVIEPYLLACLVIADNSNSDTQIWFSECFCFHVNLVPREKAGVLYVSHQWSFLRGDNGFHSVFRHLALIAYATTHLSWDMSLLH
jgi:hypothetical protein